MVVRVVAAPDVAAVAALRSLWLDGVEPADADLERRVAVWLAADGERRTTWLAEVGGRAVGMVSLFEYRRMPKPGRADSCWGYIGNLFVRDEFRARGVGSALLSALVEAADGRSYARLVVSPSVASVPLYRRAGFASPDAPGGSDALLVRRGGAR